MNLPGKCLFIFGLIAGAVSASAAPIPKIIAYSAQPNAYFDDHAEDIAQIYDGLFFVIGSWDEGVAANLGVPPDITASTTFLDTARENLKHLNSAGATENLLAVSFSDSAPWPSPETLLSDDYTARMARHFGRLGECARELGFRGVSIDVEYPYTRYSFDHAIYTFDGYSADDLIAAAARQGGAVMTALLDAFPEAVVFELPGYLRSRAIERAFTLSMIAVMAERDAPGGFHLGTERAYCLLDPISQVAIPREGDLAAYVLLEGAALDYWKRRCTVAPGVWPLHMVETGGPDYPVRPWNDELDELRGQMRTLRTLAKRYLWSFSGHPVWYPASAELAETYALPKHDFDGAAEAITGWHGILREKRTTEDPQILDVVQAVREFDRSDLGPAEFCGRLGTPGDWLILGPFDNPFVRKAFPPPIPSLDAIRAGAPADGRDGVVRWYAFHNYEPLGTARLREAMEWRGTDNNATLLASIVSAPRDTEAFLWIGWDDGATVHLNGKLVFDRAAYPERGHGILFKDRYNFEEHVPISIPQGDNLLVVTSINAKGSWGLNLRIADEHGFPLEGLTFSLPPNRE